MDIELHNKYRDLFGSLTCLLCYFLDDTYYDDRKNIDTIKRYVSIFDKEELLKTLNQGKEVLALDPFPTEWILDTVYGGGEDIVQDRTKKWLTEILELLEEEAKKAGKL